MLIVLFGSLRGAPGALEQVEIDTANFIGNFPESCEVHALSSPEVGCCVFDYGRATLISGIARTGLKRRSLETRFDTDKAWAS